MSKPDNTGMVEGGGDGESWYKEIGVTKADQLSGSSKDQLHITIAYHTAMDLPRNIIVHTMKWLWSLGSHHRSATLTRWGEKSDLIHGNFEKKAREFTKRMGLKLHTPLQFELRLGSQHNLLNQKEDTNHTIDHQPWKSWSQKQGKSSCSDRENRYKSNVNNNHPFNFVFRCFMHIHENF